MVPGLWNIIDKLPLTPLSKTRCHINHSRRPGTEGGVTVGENSGEHSSLLIDFMTFVNPWIPTHDQNYHDNDDWSSPVEKVGWLSVIRTTQNGLGWDPLEQLAMYASVTISKHVRENCHHPRVQQVVSVSDTHNHEDMIVQTQTSTDVKRIMGRCFRRGTCSSRDTSWLTVGLLYVLDVIISVVTLIRHVELVPPYPIQFCFD